MYTHQSDIWCGGVGVRGLWLSVSTHSHTLVAPAGFRAHSTQLVSFKPLGSVHIPLHAACVFQSPLEKEDICVCVCVFWNRVCPAPVLRGRKSPSSKNQRNPAFDKKTLRSRSRVPKKKVWKESPWGSKKSKELNFLTLPGLLWLQGPAVLPDFLGIAGPLEPEWARGLQGLSQ